MGIAIGVVQFHAMFFIISQCYMLQHRSTAAEVTFTVNTFQRVGKTI